MTKILAITNQKGGVGKTTTAVNLGASLGRAGKRVLLVDIDPQGNATVGSGIDMRALDSTVYEVLLGDERVAETVVETDAGYRLLPSHPDLAGAQVEMMALADRDFRLRNALATATAGYDYILIDCPPSLNVLTINALVAASGVLIPVQCEYYALEGLSGLVDTIAKVRQVHNPALQIAGLVRTMFDGRNRLANEVSDQLREHFGERLFRTVIPRNVRLAEAPGYGKPVLDYDRHCVGARAYVALAGEVLRRV
ncbi:MAG: ParA family protein [Pseudomonadota bacterium]|nr:ParA family protein [Pseudomonadota bacterium]